MWDRKYIGFIVGIIIFLGLGKTAVMGQAEKVRFADKAFYLVDSLVLEDLAKEERTVLDSLLKEYHDETEDSARLKLLHQAAESLHNEVWFRYNELAYAKVVEKLSSTKLTNKERNFYKVIKADAINNRGIYWDHQGNLLASKECYEKAYEMYKEVDHAKGMATSVSNLGALYFMQGKIGLALENFNKALKMREAMKDQEGMAIVIHNIAAVYNHHGQREEAIESYKMALEISKNSGDDISVARSLANMGVIYKSLGDTAKALESWYQALDIKKTLGDKDGEVTIYLYLGDIERDRKQFENALNYYNKGLEIANKQGRKRNISLCMKSLAELDLEHGRLADAEKFGSLGLEIAKELEQPQLILGSARLMYKIYEKQKRGMEALEMHKLYVLMKDSLSNNEHRKEAIKHNLESQYAKQKAIDDKETEKKLALQKESEKQQKLITYFVVVALILVAIFMIFIVNRLRLSNRQKRIITDQKQKVDEAYEELNQINEEIMAQRDQIEIQKETLETKNDQLNKKNKQITHSINYARSVQENVLSTEEDIKEHFANSFVLYLPKDILSGDFYWIRERNNVIYLAVADCTGHGISGAMLTIVCNKILDQAIYFEKFDDPAKMLDYVHEEVVRRLKRSDDTVDGMDISLCIFDKDKRKLKFSGAHNNALVVRNGEVLQIRANIRPIGFTARPSHFDDFVSHNFECLPGDQIYMSSDGYVDQFGEKNGEKFSTQAYTSMLINNSEKSMQEQCNVLKAKFREWKGEAPQIDDVCVVGIRID